MEWSGVTDARVALRCRATPAVLLQVPQLLEGGRHLLERVIQGLMAGIGVVGHASLVLQVLEGRLLRYAGLA